MTLSNQTIEILEDIERRLDPEAEDDYMKQWEDFLYDRFDGGVFTPRRKTASELNFKHPDDVVALIGHTRHSTQATRTMSLSSDSRESLTICTAATSPKKYARATSKSRSRASL